MKKHIFTFTAVLAIGSIVFFACKKKDDGSIKPTYKEEATGTAANPQPNNVTVTGAPTSTTPPTNNSYLYVGGGGWSNPSCASTNNGLYLKSTNGSCEVTMNFAAPPPVGTQTYQIASSPGINAASFMVTNAPDQPAGVVWYGKSGTVVVTTAITNSITNINANIQGNVTCVQSSFGFPVVSVSGVLGCN
jgi:hypothetical protein